MGALFDFLTDVVAEFVWKVLVCGAGRLVLGAFGRRLPITGRTEPMYVALTGLALWTLVGVSLWWALA